MSNVNEIHDDEFRVIGTHTDRKPEPKSHKGLIVKCAILALFVLTCVGLIMWHQSNQDVVADNLFDPEMDDTVQDVNLNLEPDSKISSACVMHDSIIVNDIQLDIFVPVNAKPSLAVGKINPQNENIVLCTQATDVRADNGQITGSFIINGELISHGYSHKWGFCSIIGDRLKLGAARETPEFEESLNNNGSFFRQHPLIVNGHIYKSTIKGKAVRKALCEIDGKFVVVMTRTRESIHDFSLALHDIKSANAIYLVGADSYTFYRDENGDLMEFNTPLYEKNHNVNYIYWSRK